MDLETLHWLSPLITLLLALVTVTLYFGATKQRMIDLERRVDWLEKNISGLSIRLDDKLDKITEKLMSLDVKLAALDERWRLADSHKGRSMP